MADPWHVMEEFMEDDEGSWASLALPYWLMAITMTMAVAILA